MDLLSRPSCPLCTSSPFSESIMSCSHLPSLPVNCSQLSSANTPSSPPPLHRALPIPPTGVLSSSKNVISVPITSLVIGSNASAVETSVRELACWLAAPSTFPKFSGVEVSVAGSYTVTISSQSTISTSVMDLPSRPSCPSCPSSPFSESIKSCSDLPSLPGDCSQIS